MQHKGATAISAPRPAFVYIPGLHGDSSLFAFLAQPVRMLGFRPLAFDFLHFDAAQTQMVAMVARLRDLLDAEGATQAVILAESYGTLVAQTFARTDPARVAALVLMGGFAHMPGSSQQILLTRTPVIRDIARRLPAFVTNFNRHIGAPSIYKDDPIALRRAFDAIAVPQTAPYWERGRIALDFDSRPWLRELTPPALVMTGEHDAVVPPPNTDELARLLPNATRHIIPGTGHLSHFARPDLFVDQLRAFCAAHALLPQPEAVA